MSTMFNDKLRELRVFIKKFLSDTEDLGKKPSPSSKDIPQEWMYLSEFHDNYPFVATSTISQIVSENKDKIDSKVCKRTEKHYFNQIQLVQFLESDKSDKYPKVKTAYNRWRKFHPALMDLRDEALGKNV